MNNHKALRVVIAEDEKSMQIVIERQLIKLGHEVVGKASDGQQAFEQTQSLNPDIVLMDIDMPKMNGLEATRMIQEQCPRPVVLLTGYDESEMIRRASQAGAGAYLLKPPNASEIERSMQIAIARFDDLMEMRRLNLELKTALENVKVLRGLVPICASCKKIRDDKGYWEGVETYITKHADVEFSHGVCPECIEKLYPEYKPKK